MLIVSVWEGKGKEGQAAAAEGGRSGEGKRNLRISRMCLWPASDFRAKPSLKRGSTTGSTFHLGPHRRRREIPRITPRPAAILSGSPLSFGRTGRFQRTREPQWRSIFENRMLPCFAPFWLDHLKNPQKSHRPRSRGRSSARRPPAIAVRDPVRNPGTSIDEQTWSTAARKRNNGAMWTGRWVNPRRRNVSS